MILAVMQARCSSNRLPRKVLKLLLGRPMILYEMERLAKSRVDKSVLATSTETSDDKLASVVSEAGWDVYRGNLDDVLDRYYQCAKVYRPDHVLRVTGDCPFLDWQIIDKVIDRHLAEGNDYTSNTLEYKYPDGLDAEIMTFSALEQAWHEARLASEREHVTLYLKNHPEKIKQGSVVCEQDLSRMRWTVDEPEDFEFARLVYEHFEKVQPFFLMEDVLGLLHEQPNLMKINQGFIRNEGLLKSLREDHVVK